MKCFYEDKPKGDFIAIYDDVSSCHIFRETAAGKFTSSSFFDKEEGKDVEVDSDWFADAGFLWWIPLPDDFIEQIDSLRGESKSINKD